MAYLSEETKRKVARAFGKESLEFSHSLFVPNSDRASFFYRDRLVTIASNPNDGGFQFIFYGLILFSEDSVLAKVRQTEQLSFELNEVQIYADYIIIASDEIPPQFANFAVYPEYGNMHLNMLESMYRMGYRTFLLEEALNIRLTAHQKMEWNKCR